MGHLSLGNPNLESPAEGTSISKVMVVSVT
jgi:hypothetical protein